MRRDGLPPLPGPVCYFADLFPPVASLKHDAVLGLHVNYFAALLQTANGLLIGLARYAGIASTGAPTKSGNKQNISEKDQNVAHLNLPIYRRPGASEFIHWLGTNPSELTKTPVFWTGSRVGPPGPTFKAETAARNLVAGMNYHAPQATTIFDTVTHAGRAAQSVYWRTPEEWGQICAAFVRNVKPMSRKAIFVYYPRVGRSVWNDFEWPELLRNRYVERVETFVVAEDGMRLIPGPEIKMSGRGNPFRPSV
ncbi:hypothetical protein H0H92_009422 [Tricholoma furcatifolium]|nr:hypothetical protein H0H92_009422 [Tricholoma furcatifolium]